MRHSLSTTKYPCSSSSSYVLDESLVGISLSERVVLETNSDGKNDLKRVGDGVGNGCLGGIPKGKRKGGHGLQGLAELRREDIVGDVKNLGVEHGAIVVDLLQV